MLWHQKKELRALKNSTITTSSKVHRRKRINPSKRWTQLQHAALPSLRCNYQISIILWNDSFFYLDSRYTNLRPPGHPYIPTIAKKLGSAEITGNQALILQQLSVMGVQKSKFQVYWAHWNKLKDHFLFRLSRTTWHVISCMKKNLVWIITCLLQKQHLNIFTGEIIVCFMPINQLPQLPTENFCCVLGRKYPIAVCMMTLILVL